ncbi:MAG TPA: hypothetical protein PLX49_13175, partial [Prolixibacteraceae bacterium]|nr:hypothetical protein [Prolixibacteraceae bacterium]
MMTKKQFHTVRLGSIDVLRGFDLFCLTFFQPVLMAVSRVADLPFIRAITPQFEHVAWEGFVFWDMIMPLFMFMAGASMPYAFAKYTGRDGRHKLYRRIFRRVLLLWLFGMICQGNLLGLDPQKIYLFSNTLQAIAIGYLISALLFLHLRLRWQILISAGLLLTYWALLTFVQAGSFGGGNFTPDYNLAEYVDRVVLGRFRDGVTVTEAGLDFGNYRYTWILSSLNFGVTVMTGVFAGQIMKGNRPKMEKVQWLVITGIAMVV